MLASILINSLPAWPALLTIIILASLVRNYFHKGLNRYPGPLTAHLTNLWRFVDVCRRRPDITQLELHRKFGEVVRLGPNTLSFSSTRALKTIYGLNKGFVKSDFYPVQQAVSQGRRLPSLFSTTDEAYHASLRRCVNSAFSMSALRDYEPLVEETIDVFLSQTEKLFVETGQVCNFAEWLQFFAFDVIGQITYSRRHGFIERAEDVDGIVAYLSRLFSYVAPVGQIAWIDLLFLKNPILLYLDKLGFKPFAFPIATFAKAHMAERLSSPPAGVEKSPAPDMRRSDLLTQFLKAQREHPDFMTADRVLTMAVSMAFAGSETTAISLAAVFYHLLQNPGQMRRLMDELEAAESDGRLATSTNGKVSWTESQSLPYLDAVIKESFRIHPAAGLPLERVTPLDGVIIGSHKIPGGTIVGVNAWVIHKDVAVFDALGKYHVDEFHPERWLDIDLRAEQVKEMNGTMFQFGAGSRTCIGKNISLLEMYKLVPSFLRNFEIELADPSQGWKLHNAWFVKQFGFNVMLRRRNT